jgi:Carbohydrate esterase, sialic acid-specific acetylesterase
MTAVLGNLIVFDGVIWNVAGRTLAPQTIATPATTRAIITFGQSNITGQGGTRHYTPISDQSHNLNLFDGRIYVGQDPVLGCTGSVVTSGPTLRIADRLITSKTATRVIMEPIGIGGTWVELWTPSSPYRFFNNLRGAILRVRAIGLEPSAILCAIGGSDNTLGTPARAFRDGIWTIVDAIRTPPLNCNAPFYLGTWTLIHGITSPAIQEGTAMAIDPGRNIRPGYDGDARATTAGGYRLPDETHLSDAGLELVSLGWADLVAEDLGR